MNTKPYAAKKFDLKIMYKPGTKLKNQLDDSQQKSDSIDKCGVYEISCKN